MNRAFERLFGYRREQLIGKMSPDLGIADAESRAEVGRVFARQGSLRDFECVRRTRSGEKRVISLSLDSITLGGEEFVLTTAQDVTERARAQAAALEAEGRLRVEAESTRLLLEAIEALSGSLTLDEVLERLLDVIQSLTGRPRAFVNRLDDERHELTMLAGRGEDLPRPGTPVPFESLSPTVGQALAERRIQVLDFDVDPPAPALRERYRSRLVLFVPLFAGDELIGHMGVDTPGERVPFEDREVELLGAVAAQAAVAIQNAALFEEVAARERLSTGLNEINELIHTTLSAQEVMERVVERARSAAGADSVMIAMRHGEDWVADYGSPEVPGVIGEKVSIEEAPFVLTATTERRPVAIEDCDHDERCIPEVQRRFGIRSVLCIPLVTRDEVVGVIFFNHHTQPARFERRTVEFADKLAVAVSSALENARLYEEQQSIATTLQENLIHPPPEVPGLDIAVRALPARSPDLVGGDFSDLFLLEDRRVVIVIGDVAGKGIRAAGLTETIRSTVRAFACIDAAPAFILRKANEVLLRRELGQPHVTALLCLLDPASGEATMASAGHPPPVHVSPSGSALVDLSFGMPLGTMTGDYLPCRITLDPKDYLVLFTDGVVDARRGSEFFGEERLLAVVDGLRGASAEQMAAGLADAALAFGGSLGDDLQLTVVRLD